MASDLDVMLGLLGVDSGLDVTYGLPGVKQKVANGLDGLLGVASGSDGLEVVGFIPIGVYVTDSLAVEETDSFDSLVAEATDCFVAEVTDCLATEVTEVAGSYLAVYIVSIRLFQQ